MADALGEEEGAEWKVEEDLAEELGGADYDLEGGGGGHGLLLLFLKREGRMSYLSQGIKRDLEITSYRSLVLVELAIQVSRGLVTKHRHLIGLRSQLPRPGAG